jgi:hypothetical protein
MMAWQVAAKTARDSLFLSEFPSRALPAMDGAACACAILLAMLSARLLRRFGPFRLIPAGYLLSAALHAAEWRFLKAFPGPVSVMVYIHVVALGAVLLSGFWAVANEQFDPRQARKRFGRIAGFGTLGALAGGVMAAQAVTRFSNSALLPLLMALQVACGVIMLRFLPPKVPRKHAGTPRIAEVLSRAPYLVGLAGLVLLTCMAQATLDFLFKSQARAQYGRGEALSQFFAVFYMSTSAVSFLAQAGGSRFWLDRFGLGRTVATLPTGVAGASLLALLHPGTIVLSLVRGLEQVLRGSLFRSGYELFYTPMPEAEKRSVKPVIDIGADRLGGVLGAGANRLLLMLPANRVTYCILLLTAMLAGIAAWLSFRLDRAYGVVLAKNLAENTVDLKHIEVEDFTTRSVVMSAVPVRVKGPGRAAPSVPAPAVDSQMQALAVLRSGDARGIKSTLREMGLLDPVLVPQVMLLLGREDVWRAAHDALARSTFRIAGQLVDCLLDEAQEHAVRMRIPRLLAACGNRLAWNGLFQGLEDQRFEMRFRCGRALDSLLQRHPDFQPDPAAVYRIIGRELSVSQGAWEGRQHTIFDDEEGDSLVDDQALRHRMSQSLAHIFCLLGLVLPREAVQTAFRALHTDDSRLRALALEYVESALPRELREPLGAHIQAPRPKKRTAPTQQLLATLLDESPSIVARLEDLKLPRTGDKPHPRHNR